MTSFAKKFILLYFLFLFTTINGNPVQPLETLANGSNDNQQEFMNSSLSDRIWERQMRREKFEDKNIPVPKPPVKMDPVIQPKSPGVVPIAIEIPAIDVKADVVHVGKAKDGSMAVPEDIETVGWYNHGAKPGDSGNAVMAGHVDGLSGPAIFYNLNKLEKGDQIHVADADGNQLTFVVTKKKIYMPDEAPLMKIFGDHKKAKLNLITCTGSFNRKIGHYEERLVVYTELVEQKDKQ
ncbi:class F sortase [Planococcus shenhongbingii]|uniref:Class F sortase n=1 Tax=Planococcus shenhongbingii TaxID=3058398 RepID=A0ABT8NGK2_9BACL|nr:class F sortase [Planococcus sp. N017]MDN7247014.1 class F sortase [Planococcus sp. N017]